jgi:hypothetical protein
MFCTWPCEITLALSSEGCTPSEAEMAMFSALRTPWTKEE